MISLGPGLQAQLVTAVAETVIAHAQELSELDQAIGDGDHGANLKRGFEAVLAQPSDWTERPLGEALHAIGMQLVMHVGGASGPLYGTLFMALGEGLAQAQGYDGLRVAIGVAVDAVKARGRSHAGQKSLIDVLQHVQVAFPEQAAPIAYRELKSVATSAAQSTIAMRARCGRAAFLGDRSVGHMDPGARSAALIVSTICDILSGDSQACQK